MKTRFGLYFAVAILFLQLLSGCSSTPLLRYGNQESCVGYFGVGRARTPDFYFPMQARDAQMIVSFHRASGSFVLLDKDENLWLLTQAGTGGVEQISTDPIRRGADLVLSKGNRLAAVTTADTISILSFGQEGERDEPLHLRGAGMPVWHPIKDMIAAKYYSDEERHGSNSVALFGVEENSFELAETHDLKRLAIADVFDWSSNGDVIAVSQYDRIGSVIYYLFVEDGKTEHSLFYKDDFNCVLDAQWSPAEEVLAFSAESSTTEGQDIFLERVPSTNKKAWSLVNVTQSPGQDERNVTWSPDGTRIAFMKAFVDDAGAFRQELYMVDAEDESLLQVQLTDTEEQYETDPMWISDSEIAFLSWDREHASWSLSKVSAVDHRVEQIMEIPESWYAKF